MDDLGNDQSTSSWSWGVEQTDLEEGQVLVLQGVGDLQVLQDHSAVAVGLHHAQVVVLFGAQKVKTVGDALAYCRRKSKQANKQNK